MSTDDIKVYKTVLKPLNALLQRNLLNCFQFHFFRWFCSVSLETIAMTNLVHLCQFLDCFSNKDQNLTIFSEI